VSQSDFIIQVVIRKFSIFIQNNLSFSSSKNSYSNKPSEIMKLQHLEIHGLHGSMNVKLDFNPDITMLVGINGSGKTSALNAIDWLLRPNLKKLAQVSFEKITLCFALAEKNYNLKASKTKNKLTLSLIGAEIKLQPITVDLVHLGDSDEVRDEMYDGLRPEKHEVPLWNLLQSFPKPIVITLDRTITAEVEEQVFEEAGFQFTTKKSRPRSPLGHVIEVTSSKYAEFRKEAIKNDGELKTRLAMSALQAPYQISHPKRVKAMTKAEIPKLQQKVTTYLSQSIKTEEVKKQVDQFFNALKMLEVEYVERGKGSPLFNHFMLSQYMQIDNLAKAFNEFETKNANAYKDLKSYIDTINTFFNDSGKELHFDASTGRLVFSMKTPGEQAKLKRGINNLSSGERQILILFTFLAFIAKSGSVFIVDEPEISLHPKWQSEFMAAFLSLCPTNTQLLLATHSPEIVGRHKEKCVTPEVF
jgi:predicted ATP-dependent endonuclease of OLD family